MPGVAVRPDPSRPRPARPASYWLTHRVRAGIPRTHKLANAEFATIRLRLFKVAARISETATRVRLAFTATCPEAALFRSLVTTLCCRSP